MIRALLLLAALAGPAAALKTEFLPSPLAGGLPVEVISEQAAVKFSTLTSAGQKSAALAAIGGSVRQEFPAEGWTFVDLAPGMGVASALGVLRNLPGVEAVEPNHAYRVNLLPSDPLVSQQYAINQMNLPAAWEYETGASNLTTIAVLDAGVQAQTDLTAKMAALAHAYCSVGGAACATGAEPITACNHGTRVAGVAAASANNAHGISGVSWSARVLSVRIFDDGTCTTDCGGAGCVTSNAAIINAINYVRNLETTLPATYGRVVINMSIGGAGACSGAVQTAMNNAVTDGIPVVVASGNDGGAVNDPANCASTTGGTGIIPVGATDALNNVTSFSSRGPELSANGVVAPGKDVATSDLGGNTANASGTSFSAPHVAGLASLILSNKPAFTPAQVQSTIRSGAEGIGLSTLGSGSGTGALGNASGAGRVNAFRSMRLAVNGSLAGFEGDQKAIAFPNPFRLSRTATVSFTIPTSLQGDDATIKIYTVSGELVREITGLVWDGKNQDGHKVASGTYIFVVSTGQGTTRGRVAVIR